MKKRGLALFLAMCMMIAGSGNITSYASETPREIQASLEEVQQDAEEQITDEISEVSEENGTMGESEGEFRGEREVDESNISVMDENGNITYVDMSADDTIVEEGAMPRAATPQIVNFRYKSGVIDYTEIATGESGYTAGSYGADAAYLGKNGNKVRFMLAGVIGEVPASNVQVISKTSVKSVSYYTVSGGRLNHYISTNVNSSNYGSVLDNGPAPSYLKSGTKYYSYDGHYFYTDANFGNMIDDYNKGTRTYSVNPSNPYYNYFQYLPIRSQSNYSGSALNTMLNNRVTSSSKMRNTGNDFANHQNKYGANALIMIGIGANESGWGTSSIAQKKNNLFGLNAVDSSPGQSANYFTSVSQCIKEFAEKWLSKEYLNPKNWKCFGAFLGNKASGINVKYASDPYWGEKAAAMAWLLDRSNGNRDANKYTIGIKDTIKPDNVVNVRKDNTTSSTVLYQIKKHANRAVLILNNTPTNKFYKIQSEGVLNGGRTAIDSSTGVYNFNNMYAYVSSDYVKIVSKGNGNTPSPDIKNGWITEGGKKYYYVNGSKVKGEKQIDGKWYCFDNNSGAMITGWHNLPGKKVYYKPTGEIVYGEYNINGNWYYFQKDTGRMLTGWQNFDGRQLYYKTSGEMVHGEYRIDDKWYYFHETSGAMQTGFVDLGNKTVYYARNGQMVYGTQEIDGVICQFHKDTGALKYGWSNAKNGEKVYLTVGGFAKGQKQIDGKWYYFHEMTGRMQTGFVNLGNKTVYYAQNGQMVYGKQEIDGIICEFHKDTGALQYGWSSTKTGEKVYLTEGGVAKGQKQIDGEWYLFDEKTGYMQIGFVNLDGRKVYYRPSGEMVHGEYRIDGHWYYFHIYNGGMQTGFVNLGSKTVYYAENGQMLYGKQEIDGVEYEFHKDTGALQYGWSNTKSGEKVYLTTGGLAKGEKQIDGEWYLFDEKTGYMQTGFSDLSGRKVYYKPSGEMVHGEYRIDGKWYYFHIYNGGMQTGFIELPDKTVYYDIDGTMVYGEKRINGKWYYFQKDTGRMERNKTINGHYYGPDGVRR